MFVTGIGKLDGFLDGRKILHSPPIHSPHFVVATTTGVLALVANSYVAYKLWLTFSHYAAFWLGVIVGLQIIYQWIRVLRYYAMVRELYMMKSEGEAIEDSPIDAALRIALGCLTEMLSSFYVTLLIISIIFGGLLPHLMRVR